MSYLALYRKYRPNTFEEIVGQEYTIKTLINALEYDKIAHAYIFSGPRGTGKTSVAKIFSKAINCFRQDKEKYPGCKTYISIDNNKSTDIVELDAASNNGVDEIRDLREKVNYLPVLGKYKVYIVDEFHMLTTGAFNALLKTLEEPPKNVVFILATTEIHKVPKTILSRCQRFDFKLVDSDKIIKRLKEITKKEKIEISKEALLEISKNAKGSVRDAISLLDQVCSFSGDKITVHDVHLITGSTSNEELEKLLELISKKKTTEALEMSEKLIDEGKEVERLLVDFLDVIKNRLISTLDNKNEDNQASKLDSKRLYHYLDILIKLQSDIKFSNQKEKFLEIAILKMIDHKRLSLIEMQNQLNQLKQEVIFLRENSTRNLSLNKNINKKKEMKKLVTVKNVLDVLYKSNKKNKENIQKSWSSLTNYDNTEKEIMAHLLMSGEVVAVSNKILITYNDLLTCERLYEPDIKKKCIEIINDLGYEIDDYFAILDSDWIQIKRLYLEQWKKGIKKPTVKEFDLKLYTTESEKKTKKIEDQMITKAKEFFGEKIKIKE